MVTNLPAEAKAKWVKYSDAKTPEEKLKALQEFLSAIPKHKGTE
ncbi:MAG: GTP-binding protein, partial [Sulfolobales archaeon]